MKKQKKQPKKPQSQTVEEIVKIWRPRSTDGNTDVLGSYTGTAESEDGRPVQDADDL